MAIYANQNNIKPKSLMQFLVDKEEEWKEISKLSINKLGKKMFGKIMHDKDVEDKAKHCITTMMKKANLEYDDLVSDDHTLLSEGELEALEDQWVKKFTPDHTIEDKENIGG